MRRKKNCIFLLITITAVLWLAQILGMHSSIGTTKSEVCGKNNKYRQGLHVMCHHLGNNTYFLHTFVFYLDNTRRPCPILSPHGLTALNPAFTVRVWGDETLGQPQRALFRFLLGPLLAYHPSYFSSIVFPVYSLYTTSTRPLSTAPGESDRVCQRHLFQRSLSTPALYQPSLGQGTNTNKPCGRRSVARRDQNSKKQEGGENNHALRS